ncbi:hypothetical protein [Thermomonospora umbrina]|uniref:hypothetical protein n=1 Tax=Thermomonospora umbrina TaxID=111806 RepID=UPI000E284D6B|nr:hypothetical protein [Thermomonospora umbrina]
MKTDPTIAGEVARARPLDLAGETLRQLRPLARQAAGELNRRELAALPGREREIARLGRTNPQAPDELEAMSRRLLTLADEIRDDALPDWNTPRRIRERSTRLLPDVGRLAEIADALREAVRPALEVAPPTRRRSAWPPSPIRSAPRPAAPAAAPAPGCGRELEHADVGRRRRYCGDACRQRARRARTGPAATAERGDGDGRARLREVLEGLPPDTRPVPSVAGYDELLSRTPSASPGTAAPGDGAADAGVQGRGTHGRPLTPRRIMVRGGP